MQRDIDILNEIENKQVDKSEYMYGNAYTDPSSPRRGTGEKSLSPSKVQEGEWSMVPTSRTGTKSTVAPNS